VKVRRESDERQSESEGEVLSLDFLALTLFLTLENRVRVRRESDERQSEGESEVLSLDFLTLTLFLTLKFRDARVYRSGALQDNVQILLSLRRCIR
jgi:hypothetical protein